MNSNEPNLQQLANPLARYVAATRPAFLSVTLVGALIGLATAVADGHSFDGLKAFVAVFFALVAHAGANVINDYYDALNGSDAGNHERLFPFTGGSRFIQNGVLSLQATRRFGYWLLAAVVPAGLWLTWHSSTALLLIGCLGLLAAWAYSAPPLQLMSRGWGESGIVLAWLLVVVGTDVVQRGAWAVTPWVAGLSFALLVAAILYLNQFPDVAADARAGKRTLVVRLGLHQARWGYLVLIVVAYGWLIGAVAFGVLPKLCLLGLLPAALSAKASLDLLRYQGVPAQLGLAIKSTIAAANAHAVLLALGLVLSVR